MFKSLRRFAYAITRGITIRDYHLWVFALRHQHAHDYQLSDFGLNTAKVAYAYESCWLFYFRVFLIVLFAWNILDVQCAMEGMIQNELIISSA